MVQKVSDIISQIQGNGAVNSINPDIHFPETTSLTGANSSALTTKEYVDAIAQGLHVKEACRVATIANITIVDDLNNADGIDGVTLATGNRVLVKDQSDAADNGIYVVGAPPTRATDYNTAAEIEPGNFVFITEGTLNGGHGYVMTQTLDIILDTTDITFTQFSGHDNHPTTVAHGGTGATTLTANGVLIGNNTSAVTAVDLSNTGDILIGDGSGNPTILSAFTSSKLNVAQGGTGLASYTAGDILYATGETTIAKLAIGGSNRVLKSNGSTISWIQYSSVCFLKGTKITLPDRSQINIEDLTLEDEVLTYNIDVISDITDKNILYDIKYDKMNGKFSQSGIRNIWINPTDSYLVINDKLKITKEHIIHFKRDNMYYFKYAKYLSIGDELFTDKDVYESVETIEEVKENINVYNFELDKDNTYFVENYLVHHYCKLCSGYANII